MSTAQTGSLWDSQRAQTGKFVVQANATKHFNPNCCEKLYTPIKTAAVAICLNVQQVFLPLYRQSEFEHVLYLRVMRRRQF